jgi:hypothetical protein
MQNLLIKSRLIIVQPINYIYYTNKNPIFVD